MTPSSGSGSAQTFAFAFSDPSGATNIDSTQTDINAQLASAGTCYTYYGRGSNVIQLADDSGNWPAGLTLGSAGTLQNSQCALNVGASSVSTSGTNLTLNLAFTFKPAFAGAKNTYMYVQNATLNSGWVQRGTWTVPGSTQDYTITASPSSQTVAPGGGTSYGITLTSVNGFSGQVSLTASGFPTGASGSFNPTPVTLTAKGQASSTLNITTSRNTPSGTYNINVQGASGSLNHSTFPSLAVSTPAQLLSAFITCVGSSSTAASCTLPALPPGSYYDVNQTILVGHSNVLVTGGGSMDQTVLVRDPTLTSPMMQVARP